MGKEFALAANVDEPGEADLRDDSTKLSAGSADTVCGRSVSSGEDLAGNDECGSVGSKVLEKVGHAVLLISACRAMLEEYDLRGKRMLFVRPG